ncbi:hypothetical protein ACQP3F_33540, partial [Escherichia coli]
MIFPELWEIYCFVREWKGQVWWLVSVKSTRGRPRQEDCFEFQVTPVSSEKGASEMAQPVG